MRPALIASSRQALAPPPHPRRLPARFFCALVAATITGCATTYAPTQLAAPAQLRDVQSKSVGSVMVSVSILTDDQARRQFGADLAEHDLQALWVSVRNDSDLTRWFIPNVLDPDFYSADEVALILRTEVPSRDRDRLRQDLRDASMRVQIAPRAISEGYVFLPRVEGGRYVDVRLQSDSYVVRDASPAAASPAPDRPSVAPEPRELRFEFALALPDGDFDYEKLDVVKTYAGRELPDVSEEALRAELERLPCCAADADGAAGGDPLNLVLVGESTQVLNSLTRAGWSFTHRITLRTVRREAAAALEGEAYAVAPVSSLYVFGRKQDLALQRARHSIAQRNHLRLWLAPFRCEGRPVWIGQVSRDIGVKATTKSPTFTTHIIDPTIDTAREYLLHSLVAHGFADRFGFVKGSAAATADQPRYNLTGDPYISDGMRLVVFLAPEPVSPDQTRNLSWERSAAPIAEGQSDAARRNVRPIEPDAGAPGNQP